MKDQCLNLQPEPVGVPQRTWAKFQFDTKDWMPLFRHLDDAACVAWCLWDEWLSGNARSLITRECGGDALLAKKIAVLVAAGHDIGKHSSAFAMQVPPLRDHMIDGGAKFLTLTPDERRMVPHAIVSGLSFRDWYQEAIEDNYLHAFEAIASIVASHHGRFPSHRLMNNNPQYLREKTEFPEWHQERMGWWERAIATAGITDEDLKTLRQIKLSQSSQLILSGLLVMCDWIASNQSLFPLTDLSPSDERTDNALDQLQLPPQWEPLPPTSDDELFASRFQLPSEASLRPIQEAAISLARDANEPCLMLIEAPTGEGKTEAALAAAEILAHKFELNGITFALPTCATSDGIFPRVMSWLGTTLQAGTQASAVLTHGRAQFNETYRELFTPKYIENVYDDDQSRYDETRPKSIYAHWWLRGRKTSSLANFTVGTIDQVLFAALSSKHLMLRHVGLSGKVVIFDEIHASDTYMMVYLERALQWLGAMGVPVIALSATLDPKRRAALLSAYKQGACMFSAKSYGRSTRKTDETEAQSQTGYPLISLAASDNTEFKALQPSTRKAQYTLEFIGEEISDIAELIIENSSNGGCIATICNTVNRAQTLYEQLSNDFSESEIVLLHSRFAATERRKIEKELVRKLGPQQKGRPKKLIVVATQVIEQSLDIDFDLLYTDIAPMDLLIQRAGRLHRHAEHHNLRPSNLSTARLVIGGFTNSQPPTFDGGSEAVYGKALLLKTLATIQGHIQTNGSSIESPRDVSGLVRSAYSEDLTPPVGWESIWEEAKQERRKHEAALIEKAKNYRIKIPKTEPLTGFDTAMAGEADDNHHGRAQVRDAEDSLDVILVQRVNDELRTLPFLDAYPGARVDMTAGIDDELARCTSMCTVSLPAFLTRGSLADRVISELEQNGIESWQRSHWLRGELPLILDEDLKADLAGLLVRYDRKLGLTVTTPERSA